MMSEIIIYLLKVSLGIGIITLSYLFLRNDTKLIIKRFYLLAGIIASWVFPFLRFPELITLKSTANIVIPAASVNVQAAQPVATPASTPSFHIDCLSLIMVLYVAGVVFLVIRNAVTILRYRYRNREKNNVSNNIVFTDSDHVFTLFSWIFLPERYRYDPDIEPVILHEKAHIKQMHFIDLIIVELTVLFTWFNPFTWLISRMIKENHEHLADREVLAGGIKPAHYRAQLLNFSLGTNYFRLGHQFNHSVTKKRFKMMKRTTTKKIGIIKYLLIIPVIILALGVLIGSEVQDWDGRVKGKVIFADTGEPATGTSVIVKGTTNGTIAGSEGIFELECQKDDILVISYVGYETQELKASWITEEPIELQGKSYEINLEAVEEEEKAEAEAEAEKVEKVERVEKVEEEEAEAKEDRPVADRETTEVIFVVVEDMPQFPGGLTALRSYIYDNLEYPEKAKQKGIEGKVTVGFTVDARGDIENVHIVRSTYAGFDDAAMKVFRNMPAWEPGKQRGHPVKVKLNVPVEFKLDKE
ncbi:MAG: TonB family protein [Bacteroidota bacterium]